MKPALPPASEASLALDALIDSVSTLRSELHERFARPSARGGGGAPFETDAGLRGAAAGWLAGLTGLDPARLLEQLRERLPFPTSADVGTEVDEFGLDPLYLSRTRPLLDFLYERWWRIAVSGADLVPAVGRVLLVANCSGVLPWDALMLAHAVEREHPWHRRPRFLVSDYVMTRPFLPPVLARLGAVRAHPENAERVLRRDEWLIAFPEGHKGALKPFRERYRLARFGRGGFVRLALRRHAVVVPVAIVGAEEIYPLLGHTEFPERWLGTSVPYTATFPWLGPLGLIPLPSHWRIRFGTPLDLSGADAALAEDPAFVARTREQVRESISQMLSEELELRYSVWS